MATKRRTESRATKARRARERDAELAAMALAMLEDPHIGERIADLVDTPRMLTYSLRNQALLLAQADARGMRLTDVDTYLGWQRRGRQVRTGEHGLKIVRPLPIREQDELSGPATQGAGEAGEQDHHVFFRTMTVFELAQTDELDESEVPAGPEHRRIESLGEPTAQPVPDAELDAAPEAVLVASLREQAERAGYLVVVVAASAAHPASVTVDEQAQAITVYDDGARKTLSIFASKVAAILATQAKSKEAARGIESASV
jgi:hypothetical protein